MAKTSKNNDQIKLALSLIIPAHNEKSNLQKLVNFLKINAKDLPSKTEVIIVDDASTDGSESYIFPSISPIKIIRLRNSVRLGKSDSILAGYSVARGEHIAILDADLADCMPHLLTQYSNIGTGYAVTYTAFSWKQLFKPRLHRGPKIFPRHVFTHLNPTTLNEWNIEAELVYTAANLGLSVFKVKRDTPHVSRPKSILSKIKKIHFQNKSTLRYIFSNPVYVKLPVEQMIGAGVTFKKKHFVTHSTLPHNISALKTFAPWQIILLSLLIITTGWGLVANTTNTLITLTATLSFIYLLDVVFNFYVTLKSLHFPPEIIATSDELARIKDKDLPIYSILVPLYKEANVLPEFIHSMDKLEYPKNKLDIMLLLEEDDVESIEKAKELNLPAHYRTIIVPHSYPKTKPKACNYGLAFARGEYVVIYDAEDKPEPLQLKKAYLALSQSHDKIGCVQAKLNYFNSGDNLLTRFFTAEYSLWFDVILPGLQSIKTTIPLGGTSNHFKTQLLRDLHGWDAFNVTEDADLGTRLFNAGYQTAIIDSTTLEEANNNFRNWIRQRSRWLKGYMQTYLVHMRHPLALFKKQGVHALLFNLIVGGKISFILINPFLWVMTISYFVLYAYVGAFIESIYPAVVFYMAVTSLLFGNFIALYNYMIGCAKRGHYELIKYVFLIPLYWLAISYAAAVAMIQLVTKPHYWEKTLHGLTLNKPKKSTSYQGIKRGKLLQSVVDRVSATWSAGGVMVLANVFGNFMNFLYNAYLSRRLDVTSFGDIALFSSFFYLTSVPISGLSRSFSHTTAYLVGKYVRPVKNIYHKYIGSVTRLSIILMIVWVLASPLLKNIFQVASLTPFIIFAPIWLTALVGSANSGYLSGNLIFSVMALSVVVETLVKFGAAASILWLGRPELVYGAVTLSLLAAFILESVLISRKKNQVIKLESPEQETKLSRRFYLTSVLTTLSSISYITLDVMLAKIYLSPVEAGAYGYLSLAGKMVFFLGSMFSQFLIPYVSRDLGAGTSARRTFLRIVALVGSANLIAVAVFGFLGSYTAPLLWGSNAALIIPYLPLYSVAMALFSMTSLIINYEQLRKRYLFPMAGFALSLAQVIGMLFVHNSIESLVWVVAISALISLLTITLMSRFYGFILDVYHASVDLLGLFKPLPPTQKLDKGKLRILIFNWRDLRHKWAGGAEVYLHELSKRWVEMGHQVTIFSGNDGSSIRHERVDGVRVIRRGGFYLVYLWAFFYYIFRLRGRYDVIIDSENGLPFFTPLYAKEKVFLLIHHVHQEVFRTSLIPPFSYLASFLEKRVMPLVYRQTGVITVSPSSKAEIIEHKLTKKVPHIIYNGVDLTRFVPGKKAKDPTILYLGRLTTSKSVHILIHAVASLHKDIKNLNCIIAGDGPVRAKLEKLVTKLKLSGVIKFVGKVSEEEKIRLYQKAWVFVNPSLLEGWGITTIEANACGTPVVASNVSGLRDAVEDGVSGILVPYGNDQALSLAIETLLSNSTIRSRLSRGSCKWAQKFEWNISASSSISYLQKSL